jgi:hypothetical protein
MNHTTNHMMNHTTWNLQAVMRSVLVGILAWMLGVSAGTAGVAPCPSVVLPFHPIFESFGQELAIDEHGERAALGRPYSDQVRIFVRNADQWSGEAVIDGPPSPKDEVERFGASIALSADGDVLLVGDPAIQFTHPEPEHGLAFIYVRGTQGWSLVGQFTEAQPSPGDGFGISVALSDDGELAAIGAPGGGPGQRGTVTLMSNIRRSPRYETTLLPPDGTLNSSFGGTVALSDDGSTLLASDQSFASGGGKVYVFDALGGAWSVSHGIQSSMAIPTESFGLFAQVSDNGDTAIIGGPDELQLYVRTNQRWAAVASLSELVPDEISAASLSGNGARVLLGTPDPDAPGAAAVIDVSGTTPHVLGHLTKPYFSYEPRLGTNATLSDDGSTAILLRPEHPFYLWLSSLDFFEQGQLRSYALRPEAAPGDDDRDAILSLCDNCVFTANPDQSDCDADGVGDACQIEAGAQADCDVDGLPDACELAGIDEVEYQIDDGFADTWVGSLYYGSSLGMFWCNAFTVASGSQVVTAVDVAWGSIFEGLPATLSLWRDPTNDGDPTDAVQLSSTATFVTDPVSLQYVTVPIEPTIVGQVGDTFYVGCWNRPILPGDSSGGAPALLDTSAPAPMLSWVTLGPPPTPGVMPLGIHPLDFSGIHGNFLLRARTQAVADCDGDGQLDTCEIMAGGEIDIDRNGIPDDCEDCDGDAVPDGLQIARGDAIDCNGNGVIDACEIGRGDAPDCNGNGVPDQCEVAHAFSRGSGYLSPLDAEVIHTFTIADLPSPASFATITVKGIGDLGFASEYVTIALNGVTIWDAFNMIGDDDCTAPNVLTETRHIDAADWDRIVADGDAVLTATPSAAVDALICEDVSCILIAVSYLAAGAADLDSDGQVDGCGSGEPADLNHDGTVDGMDLAFLLSSWGGHCKLDPLDCLADLNHDGIVNGFDLAILLAAWGDVAPAG